MMVPSTGCLFSYKSTCAPFCLALGCFTSQTPFCDSSHWVCSVLWFFFFLVVWEIIQSKLSVPVAQRKSCSCGFSTFPHSSTSWGLARRGTGAKTAEGKVRTFNVNLTGISLLNYLLSFLLQSNTSQLMKQTWIYWKNILHFHVIPCLSVRVSPLLQNGQLCYLLVSD